MTDKPAINAYLSEDCGTVVAWCNKCQTLQAHPAPDMLNNQPGGMRLPTTVCGDYQCQLRGAEYTLHTVEAMPPMLAEMADR